MSKKKVVLVTGAPRSGTTPIGEVLALASGFQELYEPMSLTVGAKTISHAFEIPGGDFTVSQLNELCEEICSLRLALKFPIGKSTRNPLFNRTRRTYYTAKLMPRLKGIVWKDPLAVFCVQHISAVLNIPTIVTVRQPLAHAASFKRMAWESPISDLIGRMNQAGLPVTESVKKACEYEGGSANKAAILWNLIYNVIYHWLIVEPSFFAVDLDNIISKQEQTYRSIFEYAGLEWNEKVEAELRNRARHEGRIDNANLPQKAHLKNRDASSVNSYWNKVLSKDEIDFCQDLNGELWEKLSCMLN